MMLYLDDDSASALLARLLRNAGHDVILPVDAGISGEDDPVHLTRAAHDGRILITSNHDDFKNLHELIYEVGGHYPGTFVVRRDNDPKRDLPPSGIVRAIRNLLVAGVPVADQFTILNHWR
jgi:hypothetical protein